MTASPVKPPLSPRKSYQRGLIDGLPFLLVVAPFAMLFGALATEAGLTIVETMGFTIVVVAGASQFAALLLMMDNAPTFVVLTTALVVNLRMAMYSAALAPYLSAAPLWKRAMMAYFNVDQTYALSFAEYERDPALPLANRIAYFAGVSTPLCPFWYFFTYLGAVLGGGIPPEYAIDFAAPIAFLAMIAPALKTVAHVSAALTSIILALALAWMPSGTGLIVAAIVAMTVGAQIELWMERRRA